MRTFVILGIILIVVSIVGAKWALDHQSPVATTTTNEADANKPPDKIICWGYFDGEEGIAGLDPRQLGKIIEVKPENSSVKAKDILLRIDDSLARLKIEEAKADVQAAEHQVAEAKHLTKFYQLQREQQEAAIRALGHEITSLELKRDREVLPLDNKPLADTIKKFYVESLAQMAEKKKAEQAKLKQLELHDAKLKIDQAEVDLHVKNVRLKEATEMLEYYKVRAPKDGLVLRVHVHEGETLGMNPLKHAIEFLPKSEVIVRAEVLQEWGRYIAVGQRVDIEDDTYNGPSWAGEIKSIAKYYTQTRSPVIEPLRYNDVRTLEFIITMKDSAGARIGQRVRAKVKISPKAQE